MTFKCAEFQPDRILHLQAIAIFCLGKKKKKFAYSYVSYEWLMQFFLKFSMKYPLLGRQLYSKFNVNQIKDYGAMNV